MIDPSVVKVEYGTYPLLSLHSSWVKSIVDYLGMLLYVSRYVQRSKCEMHYVIMNIKR